MLEAMSPRTTALILTENSAASLPRALASVSWCEKIILIDRGSTDETLSIARQAKAEIQFHPGECKTDILRDVLSGREGWVFMLEPHEWVGDSLRHELLAFLSNPPADVHALRINTQIHFAGQATGGIGRAEGGPRLLLAPHATVRGGLDPAIHISGATRRAEATLSSEPYPDVDALFAACQKESTRTAYLALEAGGEAPSLWTVMARSKWAGLKGLVLQGGLLGGTGGWLLGIAQGLTMLLAGIKQRQLGANGGK